MKAELIKQNNYCRLELSGDLSIVNMSSLKEKMVEKIAEVLSDICSEVDESRSYFMTTFTIDQFPSLQRILIG